MEVSSTEDIKSIIAENIVLLRHGSGMTQIGLAEKLNYSDKALSPALRLAKGWKIREVLYGDPAHAPACDGCILRLGKD